MPTHRFSKIELRKPVSSESGFQNFARLFFHRAAMAGGKHTQLRLNLIVQAADV